MLAALVVPRFAFAVTAANLGLRELRAPAALAPEPGGPARVGEPSAAAAAAGVRAGMRLSEALALCPRLALLPPDPVAVAAAAETLLTLLEALGAAVEPAGAGRALLAIAPIERLYRGRSGVLVRLQDCAPGARVGAAPNRFAALAASRRARPGRPVVVTAPAVREFLAPLPLDVLAADGGVDPELVTSLHRLGLADLGALAALDRLAMRDRFGPAGVHAHALASGADTTPLAPREPPEPLVESLALPEPAASEGALDHALRVLVERLLARRERRGREPRTLRLGARLVGGGSWACEAALREPTADAARIRLLLAAKLRGLPAPAEELSLELSALAPGNHQSALFREDGEARAVRLDGAVSQVRAALGLEAALRIVAVEETSRVPERRFGLTPR
jgi:protein ImuB